MIMFLYLGSSDTCSQECLVKCLVEALGNTQTLTGGLHLRSQADLSATDFLEGEYRHLDGEILCLRL